MKLILLEGGPASGKNTLGELLVKKFEDIGDKAVLLDLDFYVEQCNPKWVWDSPEQKEKDQINARINFSKDINKHLEQDYNVIAIGESILTESDVKKIVSRISIACPAYLYHLSVPFELREQRLHARGHHSLIDLKKNQEDKNFVKNWPGVIYENVNTPEIDASNLISLITKGKGNVR